MFNAFVRRYMIAFLYIVSSVFQLEFPRTLRVAPLPWSEVHVPCFFPLAGFFGGFSCPALVHCSSLYFRINVLVFLLQLKALIINAIRIILYIP